MERTIIERVVQHNNTISDDIGDLCEDLYDVPNSAEPPQLNPQSSSPIGSQAAFAESCKQDTTTAVSFDELWFPPQPPFPPPGFSGATIWPPATTRTAAYDPPSLPTPVFHQFKGSYIPLKSDDLYSVEISDKSTTTTWAPKIEAEDNNYLPPGPCLVQSSIQTSTSDGPRSGGAKNGISIESLINRAHTSSPSKSSKGKRKYSDVDDIGDIEYHEDIEEIPNTKASMVIEGDRQASIELGSSQTGEKVEDTRMIPIADLRESICVNTAVAPDRKRQRSRLGSVAFGLSCFAAGGITAITALANLPDSFFA